MNALQLQHEADTILKLAPELTPIFLPDEAIPDILDLAEREGERGAQALLEVLAAAADDVEECEACGEPGELAIAPQNAKPESNLLRPTFVFAPDYGQRHITAQACKFLCGLCRQIRNTTSLLSEFLSSQDNDTELLDGLLEHLSAVNGLDDGLDDSAACFAWAYGLLSRAYALKVASSGIKGWTVRNPDGSSYKAGQAGSAANLTLQLLLPSASESEQEVALQSALSQETFEAAENGEEPGDMPAKRKRKHTTIEQAAKQNKRGKRKMT